MEGKDKWKELKDDMLLFMRILPREDFKHFVRLSQNELFEMYPEFKDFKKRKYQIIKKYEMKEQDADYDCYHVRFK